MPSVGGMDCLIDGRRSRLAVEDIARSALLTAGAQVRYTASRPLELPLPGRELQLWRQFYKLEDPCPAALAIVMQVSACLLWGSGVCLALPACVLSSHAICLNGKQTVRQQPGSQIFEHLLLVDGPPPGCLEVLLG